MKQLKFRKLLEWMRKKQKFWKGPGLGTVPYSGASLFLVWGPKGKIDFTPFNLEFS